jgi:hypothetical protein
VWYVVAVFICFHGGFNFIIGSERASVQYFGANNGYTMYALGRVLLLGERRKRYIWSLWPRQSYLHSFHQSDQTLCRYVRCFVFLAFQCSSPPDILAHRQLAAAISYSPLHATLHSKSHVEQVLDVVNRRHRMAQMAGRASVEFYVGLALKARGERSHGIGEQVREEAFVIRAFRNGLGVFVSK